jgi:hypothetical protein
MAGLSAYKAGGASFNRYIQSELAKKGFYDDKIDGVAGDKTHAAIMAFQKAHGIDPTGTMTAETVKALQSPDVPLPRPRPGISISDLQMPDRLVPQDKPFVSANKEYDPNVNHATAMNRAWSDDIATGLPENKASTAWINAGIGLLPKDAQAWMPANPVARMTDQPTMPPPAGLGAAALAAPGAPHFENADAARSSRDNGLMDPAMQMLLQKKAATLKGLDPTAGNFAKGGIAHVPRPQMPKPVHVGMINSAVPGRTDQLPLTVPKDSFVIPADVVSGVGQGNTHGGAKIINEMLNPHRMKMRVMGQHHRPPIVFGKNPAPLASGGSADGNSGDPVDIIAAGGEMVVPPEDVMAVGGGDMNEGHRNLGRWVQSARKQIAQRMMRLPGPKL